MGRTDVQSSDDAQPTDRRAMRLSPVASCSSEARQGQQQPPAHDEHPRKQQQQQQHEPGHEQQRLQEHGQCGALTSDQDGQAVTIAPWEAALAATPGVEYVPDFNQWLHDRPEVAEEWKWTHVSMRDALESSGAVHPVRFYLVPAAKALYAAWCFGRLMVGHPQVVHGGATAFAFDETFGALFATLNVGHGFTGNININYRKPLPASMVGCMYLALDRIEGRKVYLKGSIRDRPDGCIYSEATALFIIPRIDPQPPSRQAAKPSS